MNAIFELIPLGLLLSTVGCAVTLAMLIADMGRRKL